MQKNIRKSMMAKARYGVIGWPVAHSLSPRLHSHWIEKYAKDARYELLPVELENLPGAIKNLVVQGFMGANVTIPHKQAVMPLLDHVDALAKEIGAVNTILYRGGQLIGTNTDAFGFMENIRRHAPLFDKHKAVVLGGGGAARAVCHALIKEGFAHIVLVNRSMEKADNLARYYGARVMVAPWEMRHRVLADASLLVNSTSLGMQGKEPLDIDLSQLPTGALVSDLVYTPRETPLLAMARARGNMAIDGLGMLIFQAAAAFELWFGIRPEPDEALLALLEEMPA
jgi:shikimate dehydrogenase